MATNDEISRLLCVLNHISIVIGDIHDVYYSKNSIKKVNNLEFDIKQLYDASVNVSDQLEELYEVIKEFDPTWVNLLA